MHLLHTKVAVFRLEHRDGVGKIEDADLLAPGDGHACKALSIVGRGCGWFKKERPGLSAVSKAGLVIETGHSSHVQAQDCID